MVILLKLFEHYFYKPILCRQQKSSLLIKDSFAGLNSSMLKYDDYVQLQRVSKTCVYNIYPIYF